MSQDTISGGRRADRTPNLSEIIGELYSGDECYRGPFFNVLRGILEGQAPSPGDLSYVLKVAAQATAATGQALIESGSDVHTTSGRSLELPSDVVGFVAAILATMEGKA